MTGLELKALREDAGLTQEELGKMTHTGRVAITRYENGEPGKRGISKAMALLFELVIKDLKK